MHSLAGPERQRHRGGGGEDEYRGGARTEHSPHTDKESVEMRRDASRKRRRVEKKSGIKHTHSHASATLSESWLNALLLIELNLHDESHYASAWSFFIDTYSKKV